MTAITRGFSTVYALVIVQIARPGADAGTDPPDPTVYEAYVRAFEAADRRTPPGPNAIPFVGSSTFSFWGIDLKNSFPCYDVLNRGIPGTQFSDVLYFFDRLIARYHPPLVVLFEGGNDFAFGKSVDEVFGDWTNLVRLVHATLPNTHVLNVAIHPSPSDSEFRERVREFNQRVSEDVPSGPTLHFVDAFTPFLNPAGEPQPGLFLKDQVHLNEAGYELLASIIGPALDSVAGAYPVSIAKPNCGGIINQPAWQDDRFLFRLSGPIGLTYEVQSSRDLRSWERVAWILLTNRTQQVQIETNHEQQFFRIMRP